MKTYTKTIEISKEKLEKLNNILQKTGKELYDEYGYKRDETFTLETDFGKGIKAEVRLVIGEEDETPWTEAILLDNNKDIMQMFCQQPVTQSDPDDTLEGPWELEYMGNKYIIHVKEFSWSDKEDENLYRNGITIMWVSGRTISIQKFIEALSNKIDAKCDFSFAGGRAHIDVLKEHCNAAVNAINDKDFMEQFIVPYSEEAYNNGTYFEILQKEQPIVETKETASDIRIITAVEYIAENDETNAVSIVIRILQNGINLHDAIKAACNEYIHTEDGEETLEYNCGAFNWTDFKSNVPNEICRKYGFEKILEEAESEVVDLNETLI